MKMSFCYYLLPVFFLLSFNYGCSKPIVHSPAPATPMRVAVVVDESYVDQSLRTAYQEVAQSIRTNLVRHNFDVVHTTTFSGRALQQDAATSIGQSGGNLCQKYGTDAILAIHLEVADSSLLQDTPCRITLALDSWAYDSKGNDLGVSSSKRSTASSSSCSGAIQAAAQHLGYRAARVFLQRLGSFQGSRSTTDQIIIESTPNDTGFD